MRKTLLVVTVLIVFSVFAQAQSNSHSYVDNRGKDAFLAPRIGFGAGAFTYFGDVNDNNYRHLFASSYGFQILASANLSQYFDLDLTGIYGNLAINERSTERSLNFRSQLYIASIGVSYNFNHLYKKKPGIVQPYVGFGIGFLSFDTKSDLLDANGNHYVYGKEGGIFNQNGKETQRDYTYETDLREANLDGLGKYDLFTLALPVSAGVDFKLGKRFSSKLGVGFYYTFSDLIDGVSSKGEGNRKGDSGNDMFLFSSISVSYGIGVKRGYKKNTKSKQFSEVDFYATQIEDADQDGVQDFDDKCAQTPEGVTVDKHGCPVDSDLDVIANYRDLETETKLGSVVNLDGVTLTEEQMLKSYDNVSVNHTKVNDIYPSGVLSPKKILSKEDSVSLAKIVQKLQTRIESESTYFRLFEEIRAEIEASQNKDASANVVVEKIDLAYKKLAAKNEVSLKQPLSITKEEKFPSLLPDAYKKADFNKDGLISSDEIYQVLDEVLEGTSSYNVGEFYDLANFYSEVMKDAGIIDFGETKAMYVAGTLTVVDNNDSGKDNLSQHEKILTRKFNEVDFNKNGILEIDEVNTMIYLFKEGYSEYSQERINELIDHFFKD
ncbi:hypothetical protein ACFLR1_04950 [Bacteroidota bacterium]